MALRPCPECGHQVSDKASTCPNCGYEFVKSIQAQRRSSMMGCLVAIGAILVIGVAVALASKFGMLH